MKEQRFEKEERVQGEDGSQHRWSKKLTRKVRVFRRHIPLWLLILALVAAGVGAAVGTILSGRIIGEIPVTVSQALLVGEPQFPDEMPDDVERQTLTRIEPTAPDRAIGIVSDDQTSFRAGAEIDTGDCYIIQLPLKNASEQDLSAELTIDIPDCIEVEVFGSDEESDSSDDHTLYVTRVGYGVWNFRVSYMAEFEDSDFSDSVGIVVCADDDCAPGFYMLNATLTQISGTHTSKPTLDITKGGPDTVNLNGRADYTMLVSSDGESPASDVVVADTIPTGMEYASSSPAATVSGKTVTWHLGTLDVGDTETLTLGLRATQAGTWTNRVKVTCDEGMEAEASASTTVSVPSLNIVKIGPDERDLGDDATYTITVRNTGSVNLTNVRVTDEMPAGMSYAGSNPPGSISGDQVSWSLGSLNNGETETITLTLDCDDVGTWVNVATVTNNEGITRTASATTEIIAHAGGMSITSTDNDDPIPVGGQYTYIISVTNQGLLPLHNLRIVNEIPDETSFVSASGPAAYNAVGDTVTFDPVASIDAGDTLTYQINVLAVSDGFALNQATMTYDEFGASVTTQEGTTIYTTP